MSALRAKNMMSLTPDKIGFIRSLCPYIDEKIAHCDYETTRFSSNFYEVMKFLVQDDIRAIALDDVFGFHEKRWGLMKLNTILGNMSPEQRATFIETYKISTEKNRFTTFYNLVSNHVEGVVKSVVNIYGEELGPCFKECPLELMEKNPNNIHFQMFLDEFIQIALEEQNAAPLNILYQNNPELFKLALEGEPRNKFEFWEKDSPEKQKFLDEIVGS